MALGIHAVLEADFIPGQPPAESFLAHAIFANVSAAVLLIAGAAVLWRRSRVWGAAAIALYFGLVMAVFMNGPVVLAHYAEYGAYFGVAEGVALAAAGLIIFATTAHIRAGLATVLVRFAQIAFSLCPLFFGGAHFFYLKPTVELIPQWLPPNQNFWAYATGFGHIAAGIAILTRVQARLAAVLLTIMYAAFLPLVFVPVLMADPANQFRWTEAVMTLALAGAAWVVAGSLAQPTVRSEVGRSDE